MKEEIRSWKSERKKKKEIIFFFFFALAPLPSTNWRTLIQMSSTLYSSNLALFHTTKFMRQTRSAVSCSSAASPSNCKQDSGSHAELLQRKLKFETLRGCKLGISRYPDFEYNAEGGIGTATAAGADGDLLQVSFDITTLYIPPLSGTTTKFLGLPLPPFLNIVVIPELFKGTISRATGKVTTN